MQEEKIKAAIAECLDQLVSELYTAIAPHMGAVDESDWSDAPDWAEWLTKNDDGSTSFWENEPVLENNEFFLNDNGGRKMIVIKPISKQRRPQ